MSHAQPAGTTHALGGGIPKIPLDCPTLADPGPSIDPILLTPLPSSRLSFFSLALLFKCASLLQKNQPFFCRVKASVSADTRPLELHLLPRALSGTKM